MRLAQKNALITGVAGDIGRATALRFAAEGATLILTDIDAQRGQQTLEALGEQAGNSIFLQADLTSEAEIVALFEKARQHVDRLDILVNIAGGDYEAMIGFDEMSAEGIARNLSINLTSCMLCCREASKIMMEQESGKISQHVLDLITGERPRRCSTAMPRPRAVFFHLPVAWP